MTYYKVPDVANMALFLRQIGLRLDLGTSGYIIFDSQNPRNADRSMVRLGYSFGSVIQFFPVGEEFREYQSRILEYPGLAEVADLSGNPVECM